MTPSARANPTDVVLLSIPEAIMAEFVDLLRAIKSDIFGNMFNPLYKLDLAGDKAGECICQS